MLILLFLCTLSWLAVGLVTAAAKDCITGFNLETLFAILFSPLLIIIDLVEAIFD